MIGQRRALDIYLEIRLGRSVFALNSAAVQSDAEAAGEGLAVGGLKRTETVVDTLPRLVSARSLAPVALTSSIRRLVSGTHREKGSLAREG